MVGYKIGFIRYMVRCGIYGLVTRRFKNSMRLFGFTFRYTLNRMNNKDKKNFNKIVGMMGKW